jgi:vitamin B12 transporter
MRCSMCRVSVVQTGGPGGTTSVFLLGVNANQTKALIDGMHATDPATGTFNFEHILTWDIDRVEIVRGPQSGLYGADAIGGVLKIQRGIPAERRRLSSAPLPV